MTTRTVIECQRLARAWLSGMKPNREMVREELGGEPTDQFLKEFGVPLSAAEREKLMDLSFDATVSQMQQEEDEEVLAKLEKLAADPISLKPSSRGVGPVVKKKPVGRKP